MIVTVAACILYTTITLDVMGSIARYSLLIPLFRGSGKRKEGSRFPLALDLIWLFLILSLRRNISLLLESEDEAEGRMRLPWKWFFEAEWKIVNEAAYGTGLLMGGFSWPGVFLAGVWYQGYLPYCLWHLENQSWWSHSFFVVFVDVPWLWDTLSFV